MANHERAMLAYVRLADLSRERQQALGADKFLVLAGAAACRAGWLDVAERCRVLVIGDNPSHLLSRYPSFADAMRDANFQPYLKQQERFVGYERAEHLLREIDPESPQFDGLNDAGSQCLALLSADRWDAKPSDR
jgi:hypothetical protein